MAGIKEMADSEVWRGEQAGGTKFHIGGPTLVAGGSYFARIRGLEGLDIDIFRLGKGVASVISRKKEFLFRSVKSGCHRAS